MGIVGRFLRERQVPTNNHWMLISVIVCGNLITVSPPFFYGSKRVRITVSRLPLSIFTFLYLSLTHSLSLSPRLSDYKMLFFQTQLIHARRL